VKSISYSLAGAQTVLPTVVMASTETIPIATEGITVITFTAEDVAGNVSAPQSLTVRLDKTAPDVVITSPQSGAYAVNEAVPAGYGCTDGGSGISSCVGTVLPGAPVDTATPGSKSFTTTATDVAGNSATASVSYSVATPPAAFRIVALFDTQQVHKRGSAIPIKLRVENAAGSNVSSADLVVEALVVSSGTEISGAEEDVLDAGHANPLGRFRFVADGAYLFNLKTTNLSAGPHLLVVRVAGDPTLQAVPFLIRD
jgi:hypothetical protein